MLVRGPSKRRAGAQAALAPHVEVYPTQYGDLMKVVAHPHGL